ncbi:DUF3307 domain-containing protein [Psychroserpens sp. SPM9]|uniref:DUF3307 domain-containing protein n=1 Tax=Psychroserpens sp. SPM9 TaxID=2975598 RepID=UPI0021A4391D|nr:DUF3307 domain-containing protein [Psychroserpens sp. SPM9]MDG5493170.1 DUF3307 domain-containing protein [Psychroserpens sp. SPM9]
MLILFIKLILAHLIGDFLFQPVTWVKHKNKHKHKSKFLYYHVAVHAVALAVVLGFDTSYWLGFIITILSHYGIDVLKLHFRNSNNNRWLFALDQLAHLLVIAVVVNIYTPYLSQLETLNYNKFLLLMACLIGVTTMASIVMKTIISKWKIEDKSAKKEALKNAGTYIGILERLFVFLFVVLGFWEGIGFLLAAKSIFRFGDLSRAKDRKLTEYVLIGTLISFGMAMLIGLVYTTLITML